MFSCRSRHSRPTPRGLRAFTLIELLVVIAIIALLVSILVPSLQSARRLAQKMLCQTHLKNMGSAMNMYVSENADCIPPYSWGKFNASSGRNYNWAWQDFLIPFCDPNAKSCDGSGPGPDWNVVANQSWFPNMERNWNSNHIIYSKLFNCPSQKTTAKLIHYGVNRDWKYSEVNPAACQTPKKVSFWKNPVRMVYINESAVGGQEFDVPGSPDTMIANLAANPVHIGRVSNFCMGGGNIITMTPAEIIKGTPWNTVQDYPFHVPP